MARRPKPGEPRPARKDARGMNPVKAGVLLLLFLLVFAWFGFSKDIPFTKDFELKAVVTDAVSMRANSPVRIAGVDVGIVKGVEPYGEGDGPKRASLITMQIKDEGLPIHKDATIKIRPRIFLEGNWFIDLRPGSPSAPALDSGDTLPVTQTAAPVQFDQILTMLQSDTRQDLQDLLQSYGTALMHEPTAAEDADQDPMVHGKTAAEALNMSLDDAAPALGGTAKVNEALLGENTGDLSRLIASAAKVTRALAQDTGALKGLVTNLNRTSAALASEEDNLRRTFALLGPTVTHGGEAFAALDDALPDVRALALELVPAAREAPATIDASLPWIAQARRLVSASELGGVTAQLAPSTRSLASLLDENTRLLPQADLAAQCVTKYVLPLGNTKVQDGDFTTGVENYKEFWYTVVGFNGEGQNFDGNGNYLRFQVGGGGYAWATGPYGPDKPGYGAKRQWSRSNKPPLGTRPAYPGPDKKPPYVASKPCKDQALPDINGAPAGPADGSGPGGTPAAPYVPPVQTQQSGRLPVRATAGVTEGLIDRLNPFRSGEGGEQR